jgi:hypothetical protein
MNNGDKRPATAISMQMQVELMSFGHGLMCGTLHSAHLESPYEFFDLAHMILRMEGLFDQMRFPEALNRTRSFFEDGDGGAATGAATGIKKDDASACVLKSAIEQASRDGVPATKCTFTIAVKFRRNATWQGHVHWLQANKKQDFRSVLELLKLIMEAIGM